MFNFVLPTYSIRTDKRNCAKASILCGNACLSKNRVKKCRIKPSSQSASQSPPTPSIRRGGLAEIDPKTIVVDPDRFQYKRLSNAKGETSALRGVAKFDPNLAGIMQVWVDPSDKKTYVSNGHHRLALANRLNAEKVAVRFLNVPDARTARAVSALTNIAEGRGDELDAAKFFKESGINREDLAAKGIPMREKVATNGLAISSLEPNLYKKAMDGSLNSNVAAIIGGGGLRPEQQLAVSRLINSRSKRKELTQGVIRELVDATKMSASKTQTSFG